MRRTWSMTIWGPPRTKKTSNEIHLTVHPKYIHLWIGEISHAIAMGEPTSKIIRRILSKVRVQPKKLWRQWAKKAPATVQVDGFNGEPAYPITAPIHITAVFYRERAAGDLLGYEQGLADLLEQRKVVKNDRQFVCWDGSRLDKDKERPRVEFTLLEVGDVPRETKGEDDDTQRDLGLDRGEGGAETPGEAQSTDSTPESPTRTHRRRKGRRLRLPE